MDLEGMKKAKKESGCSYTDIAQISGVPVSTIQKIFDGTTKRPRFKTVRAISGALRELSWSNGVNFSVYDAAKSEPRELFSGVAEAPAPYGAIEESDIGKRGIEKKQGEYTIEDYFHLPENVRAELIDGRFYYMASPLVVHQALLGRLHIVFANFVDQNHGTCRVFLSPCGVQLDMDDKTCVEPDMFVLCDDSKLRENVIYGAPDFVLEILSPSTRRKDMFLKSHKYEAAGVKEYWMADVQNKRVIVYIFDDPVSPAIYSFDDKIPVSIWGGRLEVDFKEVWESLAYLHKEQ